MSCVGVSPPAIQKNFVVQDVWIVWSHGQLLTTWGFGASPPRRFFPEFLELPNESPLGATYTDFSPFVEAMVTGNWQAKTRDTQVTPFSPHKKTGADNPKCLKCITLEPFDKKGNPDAWCQGTLVCKGVHLETVTSLTSPRSNGCKDGHQTEPLIHDGTQRPIYIPHWLSGAMFPWKWEFRIQITVGMGYVHSFWFAHLVWGSSHSPFRVKTKSPP